MSEMGTRDNPINMRLTGESNMGKALALTILGVVPIAVAILAQNPALRQALQMRFWAAGSNITAKMGKGIEKANKICHMRYDLARL